MNMFILDNNKIINSIFYCDKHIVKMPLELAQMISTAYHIIDSKELPDFLFKATHINHPVNKWIRESKENFIYSCELGLALYEEYQYRYNKPEKMQRVKKIFEYGLSNPPPLEIKGLTPFALAMPDKYKFCKFCEGSGTDLVKHEFIGEVERCSHCKGKGKLSAVEAYRAYYCGSKLYNKNGKPNKWTKREIPPFIKKYLKNAKKEGITQ